MTWDYDVLILGAGPVGSTVARLVAEKGFKIGLVEKKGIIGLPLKCAGLVSKNMEKINILPQELIINTLKGAFLYSPSDYVLKISKRKPEAYVIDRISYDQYLAEAAVNRGAELLLKHKVINVDHRSGRITLKNGKILSAPVIVDARGFKEGQSGFHARQYLIKFKKDHMDTDFVDIKVNAAISPGFFWRIPLSESIARAGFFSKSRSSWKPLPKFIKGFSSHFKVLEKYQGLIPKPDIEKKLYKDRCIFIGDAAGQTKPTTGGGLVMGFRAAKIAVKFIEEALDEDDPRMLKKYHEEYHKIYDNEIKNQLRVQRTFKMLNNEELDHIFLKMKENRVEDIISSYGNLDDQTPLIREFLKRGLLLSVLPSFIHKKVTRIWKSS